MKKKVEKSHINIMIVTKETVLNHNGLGIIPNIKDINYYDCLEENKEYRVVLTIPKEFTVK